MNKFYIIIILIIIGCTTKSPNPFFEYSNQSFLERIISNLDINKELEGKISKKYRISIHSIENNKKNVLPIISLIENHLITSLINNDFIIFERDTVALNNILKEGKEKLNISPIIMPSNDDQTSKSTQLSSSEISIYFHLLETSIIFQKHASDRGFTQRDGMIRVFIRIQNTQTAEIIHTATLNAKSKDSIPNEISNKMKEFNYSLIETFSK